MDSLLKKIIENGKYDLVKDENAECFVDKTRGIRIECDWATRFTNAKINLNNDNTEVLKEIFFYRSDLTDSSELKIKLLIKNDLLTQTDNGYRVYDFFLSEWLATIY